MLDASSKSLSSIQIQYRCIPFMTSAEPTIFFINLFFCSLFKPKDFSSSFPISKLPPSTGLFPNFICGNADIDFVDFDIIISLLATK